MAESADDGQQAGTYVNCDFNYVELRWDFALTRWGGGFRFPNVTIPKGSTINSAHFQFANFSTSFRRAYHYLAFENVDSASVLDCGAGTSDLSERWDTKTDTIFWNATTVNSTSVRDSTIDVKDILSAIVNRAGWKSGNSALFLIRCIVTDVPRSDSSCLEFYSWDIDPAWGCSLLIDYTEAAEEEAKRIMWRK